MSTNRKYTLHTSQALSYVLHEQEAKRNIGLGVDIEYDFYSAITKEQQDLVKSVSLIPFLTKLEIASYKAALVRVFANKEVAKRSHAKQLINQFAFDQSYQPIMYWLELNMHLGEVKFKTRQTLIAGRDSFRRHVDQLKQPAKTSTTQPLNTSLNAGL